MANTRMAPPPTSTNGVLQGPPGGSRKKAKRRAKQAARGGAPAPTTAPTAGTHDEDVLGFDEEDDENYDYSDANEPYSDHHDPPHTGPNGVHHPSAASGKKSKKKKGSGASQHGHYHGDMLPPLPNPPQPSSNSFRGMHRASSHHHHDSIWNTSSAQERQNIKEFWLSLTEDERRALLRIEKEAVLKKMKQQQKHSCSCTVCGRKRTAIEEELEVLYEGYYEELEQYAHHDHPPFPNADGLMPDPLQHHRPHPLAAPPPNPQHRTSKIQEHIQEPEDDYSDEYEEGDEDSEEDYASDEESEPQRGVPDFFTFGQNLTVKGILTPWLEKLQQALKGKADNLLTVADDLLKNDGRKFIEMMEQLAERRMQRESEAEYAAAHPSQHPAGGYPPGDGYNQEDPLAAGDEFDDDEASYDSQDDYEDDMEEEDEMVSLKQVKRHYPKFTYNLQGGLTEEQRMQEGRRMFQIFAARMFEQRVLNAYREKVAAERQQKLLEELQDEDKLEAQRKAKKERDAQKKKEKKKQQQQAKAEEKARKEAEKAAEEARIREAQEKQQEEQRRKKEEQKKKREEEKRKQEEERARKDAEKLRRLAEEQQRREEAERKAREAKAKKEEQKKREREEREAREREARERKAQEEKEKKEREAKAKAEKEAKEREKNAQQTAQPPQAQPNPPQVTKRPSQVGMVAVPGALTKQTPSGVSSPHPSIATPAIPKAPTPAKGRQPSQQGSHASSPKTAQSQVSSAPSKSSSPGSQPAQQPAVQPKTIMQKPSHPQMGPQHPMQTTSPLHQPPMQPPPGMQHPQHPGAFGPMSPMGFPGFQGPPGPMMHGNMMHRGPMPGMFPQQQVPPMGIPNRMSFGPGGMNGMPPPGMPPQGRGLGFPFDAPPNAPPNAPPGFGQPPMPNHHSPFGQPQPHSTPGSEASRPIMPTHSRQQSTDKERFESAANQPIARPAPIQRPSSVKPPTDDHADVEDLSKHLGSSALLADDDEPLPVDARRHSGIQAGMRNVPPGGMGPIGGFSSPVGSFGAPGSNFSPFGQMPLGQPSWGSLPTSGMSGWAQNNAAFAANSAFGNIAQMPRPSIGGGNRPLTIRLAVCQACKQLSSRGDSEDGYHNVETLLRQIDANRPALDSAPTLKEIEEICETEGDAQNGGGELRVRKGENNDLLAVKWEQTAPTPDQGRGHTALGEIGSPMPSRTSPAGFGAPGMRAPFQSLSGIGGSPGY
jgi:hypothetical protein